MLKTALTKSTLSRTTRRTRNGAVLRSAMLALVLAGGTLTAVGCAKKDTVAVSNVQAAAMPAGGEWQGVYYHQVYGFLHITETSGAVQGAWRTAAGDKWGELFGEVEGDLLRFSWTEYKVGVVGPNAKSEGKGYFKYVIKNPDEAHELQGEWGLGESDAGHGWDCIKQTNMEPDPKSVRPNELESQVGATGFDGEKGDASIGKQEKKPEEKAEGEEGGEGEKSEGESE